MDWFLFLLNPLTLLTEGILQFSFLGRVTKTPLKLRQFVLCLALLSGLCMVCSLLPFHYADILFNILLLYAISRLELKASRPVSCVAAVLAVYIAQLSFGLMNSCSMLVYPHLIASKILLYSLVYLSTFLSLMMCCLCYRLVSSHISLKDSPGGLLLWLLLPPGMFLFAVELYILSFNYGNVVTVPISPEPGKHLLLLALQLLGIGVLFSSLYAYRHTCDSLKAQAALASLEQETSAQRNYVTQAQIRYENTRAFRHDIKNHLSVLDGCLKTGDLKQARDYLEQLDAAACELSFPVQTGNPTVDILLGDKLALAKMDGTALDVTLTLPPVSPLTDLDWCVIFANALDNAIRACRLTDGSKQIQIAGERQGDFYMLEFENTCPKEQPASTFGTGLNNIKSVAEKYGGTVMADHCPGLFRLNVLLNISEHTDGISIQKS